MRSLKPLLALSLACLAFLPAFAFGDGMPEERPAKRRPAAKVVPRYEAPAPRVIPPPAVVEEVPEPVAEVAPVRRGCALRSRLSSGVTVWSFERENVLPGAAAFIDVWGQGCPLNVRPGVEGRHMYLGQDAADYAREFPTKTTRVTFLRIPIGFEYIQPLGDATNLYVGGGPDIIHTASDLTETNVGMHLATRIHHAFDERFGAALEVGYMWGYLNNPGKDVNLSNAYVTPSVTYDF